MQQKPLSLKASCDSLLAPWLPASPRSGGQSYIKVARAEGTSPLAHRHGWVPSVRTHAMQALVEHRQPMPPPKPAIVFRLRKHADYQRVYKAGRKQFGKQMAFFFALRNPGAPGHAFERALDATAPRVGLTVGKVMGKAVDRNRIKRRMREAVRRNLPTLRLPVDLILHPRRSVIDLDFLTLSREVGQVFRQVQNQAEKQAATQSAPSLSEP